MKDWSADKILAVGMVVAFLAIVLGVDIVAVGADIVVVEVDIDYHQENISNFDL